MGAEGVGLESNLLRIRYSSLAGLLQLSLWLHSAKDGLQTPKHISFIILLQPLPQLLLLAVLSPSDLIFEFILNSPLLLSVP